MDPDPITEVYLTDHLERLDQQTNRVADFAKTLVSSSDPRIRAVVDRGRPVLYGSKSMLGRCLKPHEPGYQAGKDIYAGTLPEELQYLWVRYKPTVGDWDDYPIDFTWEREWRIKCGGSGLPVYLDRYAGIFKPEVPVCALVVENYQYIERLIAILRSYSARGIGWAAQLTKIVSLETVARMLNDGDGRSPFTADSAVGMVMFGF